MVNTFPRRNDVISLALGGVFLLLSLLWMWSLHADFPQQLWAIFAHPFLIALCLASAISAGWLLRRYRGGGGAVPADQSANGKESGSR